MNYKECLLIEVKCLVLYHLEVLSECKTIKENEVETKRFNNFLNKTIKKYEDLEEQNAKV